MQHRKADSKDASEGRRRNQTSDGRDARNDFDIRANENMIRLVKLLARQKAEEDFARAIRRQSH